MQRNIRDEVEQENADLEYRHPRIVQGVKLLHRQMKPSAVQPIHPIVRQQEEQPPHEQDAIVNECTLQQCLVDHSNVHRPFPIGSEQRPERSAVSCFVLLYEGLTRHAARLPEETAAVHRLLQHVTSGDVPVCRLRIVCGDRSRLGSLTTCFPDGFEGRAAFRR
jgi:hypothetical protein